MAVWASLALSLVLLVLLGERSGSGGGPRGGYRATAGHSELSLARTRRAGREVVSPTAAERVLEGLW